MAQHTMVAEAPAIQARQLGNRDGNEKGYFCPLRFQGEPDGGGGQGAEGKYPFFSCKCPIIPLPLWAFLPLSHPSSVSLLGILEAQEDGGGAEAGTDTSGWNLCSCVYLLVGCTLPKGEQLYGACMLWGVRWLQLEPLATLS